MTKQECLYVAYFFLGLGALFQFLDWALMTDYLRFWTLMSYSLCGICVVLFIYRVVQQEWLKNRRI